MGIQKEKIKMRKPERKRLSGFSCAFLTIVLLSSHFAFGQQPASSDIVIGKRISVPSKVFNSDVTISIYVPASYETSDAKYHVLYDLNAFAYFT